MGQNREKVEMIIVGLGGILKDPACAVIANGRLVAAMEEAKLVADWVPGTLPLASMKACLELAGAKPSEVDCVAVARPLTAGPGLHVQLRAMFPNARLAVMEHQDAHAASAYYASGYDQATVLTLDHAGDFRCGGRWHAHGNQMQLEKEWYYPDSLGRLYRAVTELLGFRAGADEHKVQWLSASGDDRFAEVFADMVSESARLFRLRPGLLQSDLRGLGQP